MRTTLTIDDDVLRAAKQIASAKHVSLGDALSSLARQGLSELGSEEFRNGVRLLPVRDDARGSSLAEVNKLRDELS